MGDKLSYNELLAAYRELQHDRDLLMGSVHEQAVELDAVKRNDVLKRKYEIIKAERETIRKERDYLRDQVSVLSKKLNKLTGK